MKLALKEEKEPLYRYFVDHKQLYTTEELSLTILVNNFNNTSIMLSSTMAMHIKCRLLEHVSYRCGALYFSL